MKKLIACLLFAISTVVSSHELKFDVYRADMPKVLTEPTIVLIDPHVGDTVVTRYGGDGIEVPRCFHIEAKYIYSYSTQIPSSVYGNGRDMAGGVVARKVECPGHIGGMVSEIYGE